MKNVVGLFGGTFDPVHNGHLAIANSFINSGFITDLWILLTPDPPHKKEIDHTDYQLRYEMLKLNFDRFERIKISTVEKDLPKPSYSLQTVEHLKKENPDYEFFLCIGEDSLMNFHKWKSYQSLLNKVNLLVAERPGFDHSSVDNDILDKCRFVKHTPIEVSSSAIRGNIMEGKPVGDYLNAKVETFIHEHSLYR